MWYEKITFRQLLTWSMVTLVSILFISFSLIVTSLSENKIRKNVKDNMSIVVNSLMYIWIIILQMFILVF